MARFVDSPMRREIIRRGWSVPSSQIIWKEDAVSKKCIHTENAPEPVGPYSQAIAVDGWVYVAGQVC